MSALAMPNAAQQLCLECGLCCNGVIFANGQLQPEDDAGQLRALGLKLIDRRRTGSSKSEAPQKFSQPCAAFQGCHCTIYSERPAYCRAFNCALLQQVNGGAKTSAVALKTIRLARKRAEKVRRLLRELGSTDEHGALSIRFRRANRRLQHQATDSRTAGVFGELTIAMHRLNMILSREFYPRAVPGN